MGVCFADASVRELGVSEFNDNDLYCNFEVCWFLMFHLLLLLIFLSSLS